MKVKVKVDRLVCISLASCTVMAPSLFLLDSQGKAIVLEDLKEKNPQVHSVEKKEEKDEAGNVHFIWIIDAEDAWVQQNVIPGSQACPVTAIHVWDVDANKQIYPTV